MENNSKIKTLSEISKILDEIRFNKTVVLAHGVFDLLHIGHIRYFEQAKKHGDILVVTLTPDRFVNKGPNRPVFTELLRAEAIAALDIVDFVAVNEWPTAVETINLLKPDIYAKGSDYKSAEDDITGKIVDEENAVKSVGGKIVFTDDIVFSSSKLINTVLSPYPEDTRKYLYAFSRSHPIGELLSLLSNAENLKILLIGEVIIDEYDYCDMIGVATKDPAIGVRFLSKEIFAGGIIAAANNISNFVKNVDCLAMIGDYDSQEDFIREHLNKNVNPIFFTKNDSPTIVKQRFAIKGPSIQKLFEVHRINQLTIDAESKKSLHKLILSIIKDYDLVLVVDYGHGFISADTAELISEYSKFLALNVQTNSGNRGFNVVSKYPSADFICLNDAELKIEERNNPGNIYDMLKSVSNKLSCPLTIVTQGKEGCLCCDNFDKIFSVPAFAGRVVDRIGSGDAFIALGSLFAVQNAASEVTGFIGNAAAAIAVETVGHRESIQNVGFKKFIDTLLKI
ncbi:MAG TPA: PfkB family carbohydrate kinase [Methanocorpusculum sp.]|nr:PfkB family carbohydrate kinase [Methanocorpusculum sp.]